MHEVSVPVHIWLAALVIVIPVPDAWIKTVACLIIVLALVLGV